MLLFFVVCRLVFYTLLEKCDVLINKSNGKRGRILFTTYAAINLYVFWCVTQFSWLFDLTG